MKKLLLLLSFLPYILSYSQSSHVKLNANNVSAGFDGLGMLSYDGTGANFEVPAGSGLHTIFAANLWMGGTDTSGSTLYSDFKTYGQNDVSYFNGPSTLSGQITNQPASNYWNDAWVVRKSMIDSFQIGLFSTPPTPILNWPGSDDPTSFNSGSPLAPFVDVDGDGLYNPNNGDYPKIKGDEAVFFVFNNHRGTRSAPGVPTSPSISEIQGIAYSFNSSIAAIDNTIFVEYKILNKGTNYLKDFYTGIWVDFDLGNTFDDYVGTDTVINAIYTYNGDPDDDGAQGYGTNPPVQGMILLNEKIDKSISYNNSTDVVYGNPSSAVQYYRYLQGKWKNGSDLTLGGLGTNPNNPKTNYIYNGDPVTNTGWTEGSAQNPPGDRRILASVSHSTFYPFDTINLDIAYTFSRSQNGSMASLTQFRQDAQTVINAYNNNFSVLDNESVVPKVANSIKLFPNPAKDRLNILSKERINGVEVLNLQGAVQDIVIEPNQNAIDLGHLSKGTYLIKITTDKHQYLEKVILE